MTNKVFAVHDYYWGTTSEGVPHHSVEEMFTHFEGAAATVMRTVLDDPDGALTGRWPLPAGERLHLAWWMAAQLLRTTRQRKRLEYVSRSTERLDVPEDVATIAANTLAEPAPQTGQEQIGRLDERRPGPGKVLDEGADLRRSALGWPAPGRQHHGHHAGSVLVPGPRASHSEPHGTAADDARAIGGVPAEHPERRDDHLRQLTRADLQGHLRLFPVPATRGQREQGVLGPGASVVSEDRDHLTGGTGILPRDDAVCRRLHLVEGRVPQVQQGHVGLDLLPVPFEGRSVPGHRPRRMRDQGDGQRHLDVPRRCGRHANGGLLLRNGCQQLFVPLLSFRAAGLLVEEGRFHLGRAHEPGT
ncbi:DUF4238 domain-containing protein [Streptomyces sp. NPDC055722]